MKIVIFKVPLWLLSLWYSQLDTGESLILKGMNSDLIFHMEINSFSRWGALNSMYFTCVMDICFLEFPTSNTGARNGFIYLIISGGWGVVDRVSIPAWSLTPCVKKDNLELLILLSPSHSAQITGMHHCTF